MFPFQKTATAIVEEYWMLSSRIPCSSETIVTLKQKSLTFVSKRFPFNCFCFPFVRMDLCRKIHPNLRSVCVCAFLKCKNAFFQKSPPLNRFDLRICMTNPFYKLHEPTSAWKRFVCFALLHFGQNQVKRRNLSPFHPISVCMCVCVCVWERECDV